MQLPWVYLYFKCSDYLLIQNQSVSQSRNRKFHPIVQGLLDTGDISDSWPLSFLSLVVVIKALCWGRLIFNLILSGSVHFLIGLLQGINELTYENMVSNTNVLCKCQLLSVL